jgi:chromosome segregation ATPase
VSDKSDMDGCRREIEKLRVENERLQAVNGQLKAGLDATAEANSELRADLREAQHDLAEARRALDEARANSRRALLAANPVPMSRRDWYVLAIYQQYHTNPVTDIVAEAGRFMALVDREVTP